MTGASTSSLAYAPVGFGSYHWIATDRREATASSPSTTSTGSPGSETLGNRRSTACDGLRQRVALRDSRARLRGRADPHRDGDRARASGSATRSRCSRSWRARRAASARTKPARRAGGRRRPARPAASGDAGRPSVARRIDLDVAGRGLARVGPCETSTSRGRWAVLGTGPAGPRRTCVGRRRAAAPARPPRDEVASRERRLGHDPRRAASPPTSCGPTPGPALIDWDTVALAPPERDLWMLVGRSRAMCSRPTPMRPVDGRTARAGLLSPHVGSRRPRRVQPRPSIAASRERGHREGLRRPAGGRRHPRAVDRPAGVAVGQATRR